MSSLTDISPGCRSMLVAGIAGTLRRAAPGRPDDVLKTLE